MGGWRLKWFKHVSDSLDDPFIDELMDEFGDFGYLAFFGILEIYSREFKIKDGWKLDTTLSFLRRKLHQPSIKRIATFLQSETLLKKWSVNIDSKRATIYIPKFTEIIDEWTKKKINAFEQKLQSNSGVAPKNLPPEEEEDKEEDKERDKEGLKFKRKVPIPKHFHITTEMKNYALRKNYIGDLETFTEKFILTCKSNPKKYSYQDWYAAWQKWLINDMKFHPEHKGQELVDL